MYKLFLIRRYLRRRLIALFAIVSVWLCVFMVIVVISVMGGFLDMVKEHSRGLLSDIIVDNATLQGFPFYQEFIGAMHERLPETVEAATPAIYNYGILRVKRTDYTKPVQIVGVRLDEYRRINAFGQSLYYDKYYPETTTLAARAKPLAGFTEEGVPMLPEPFESAWERYQREHPDDPNLPEFQRQPMSPLPGPGLFEVSWSGPEMTGDPMPGAIVGVDLICERLPTGDYREYTPLGSELIVTVLPMTRSGTISGEGPIPMAMRYADRSRTKVYDIDKLCVYVDFELAQRALSMEPQELEDGGQTPARASQVLVKLKPGRDVKEASRQVAALWRDFVTELNLPPMSPEARLMSGVEVETWEERQKDYITAVEKEKVLVTLLFGVISLVAVVLIGCVFYMIVSNKTRDIGIIKSIGASASGVASIFLGFGLAVGVVGSFLGTVSGMIFVHYINDLQDALARFNPNLKVWSPDVYVFDRIPNVVKADEVAVIVLVAVAASVVGALIPAFLAARVWPVDALRYE